MNRPKSYWRYKRPKNQPETQPQPDILPKFFLNPAFIIAFLTALLYFHGHALYSGYLKYWGLSTELLPLSFETTLVHGALSYIFLGTDKWLWLLGAFGYFVFLYGLVFLLLLKKPAKMLFELVHTKRLNERQKIILGETADRLVQFLFLLLILMTVILVMAWAGEKGKSLAQTEHQKIKTNATATAKIVTINYLDESSKPAEVTGTLIQPSSLMLAIYTENDDLLVIPTSRIVSILKHNQSPSQPPE